MPTPFVVGEQNLGIIMQMIGQGADFPFRFSESSGALVTSKGVERLNDSIFNILSTRVGTRFMVPTYGSRLPERVFAPLDRILKDVIRVDILEALTTWEPRITNVRVGYTSTLEEEERGQLNIAISYKIRGTDLQNVYTFPFSVNPQPGSP